MPPHLLSWRTAGQGCLSSAVLGAGGATGRTNIAFLTEGAEPGCSTVLGALSSVQCPPQPTMLKGS